MLFNNSKMHLDSLTYSYLPSIYCKVKHKYIKFINNLIRIISL